MTRKFSEGAVRKALADMDLEAVIFKPSDSPVAANWRPCDFMVWWKQENESRDSAWIEVKETPNQSDFPVSEIRPSQRAGMRDAASIDLPYWLVVYWPKLRAWTITTGERVLARIDADEKAIRRVAFLAECSTGELASTLRLCLLGEFDGS